MRTEHGVPVPGLWKKFHLVCMSFEPSQHRRGPAEVSWTTLYVVNTKMIRGQSQFLHRKTSALALECEEFFGTMLPPPGPVTGGKNFTMQDPEKKSHGVFRFGFKNGSRSSRKKRTVHLHRHFGFWSLASLFILHATSRHQ